jgi:hypothetical protein
MIEEGLTYCSECYKKSQEKKKKKWFKRKTKEDN